MNWVEIKKFDEIKLAGVRVDGEMKNNSPFEVTLSDAAGNCVKARKGTYGELEILVPAPPKMVKRVRVSAKIGGVEFGKDFESSYAAHEFKRELDDKGLEVSETEVEVLE